MTENIFSTKTIAQYTVNSLTEMMEIEKLNPEGIKRLLEFLPHTGELTTIYRSESKKNFNLISNEKAASLVSRNTSPCMMRTIGAETAYLFTDSADALNHKKGSVLNASYTKSLMTAGFKFGSDTSELVEVKCELNVTIYKVQYQIKKVGNYAFEALTAPESYYYIKVPLNRIFDADYIEKLMDEQLSKLLSYNELDYTDVDEIEASLIDYDSAGYCIDISAIPRSEFNAYLKSTGHPQIKTEAAYEKDMEVISTIAYRDTPFLIWDYDNDIDYDIRKPLTSFIEANVYDDPCGVKYLKFCYTIFMACRQSRLEINAEYLISQKLDEKYQKFIYRIYDYVQEKYYQDYKFIDLYSDTDEFQMFIKAGGLKMAD